MAHINPVVQQSPGETGDENEQKLVENQIVKLQVLFLKLLSLSFALQLQLETCSQSQNLCGGEVEKEKPGPGIKVTKASAMIKLAAQRLCHVQIILGWQQDVILGVRGAGGWRDQDTQGTAHRSSLFRPCTLGHSKSRLWQRKDVTMQTRVPVFNQIILRF